MLPHPSHLQNEVTETTASNNDGVLHLGPSDTPVPVQHAPIAKSTSDIDMGLEGQDERSDVEDRSEFLDDAPSDDDMDMSDGGAALTMTSSHAEQLNAELDMLDAEIMGSHNLGLLVDDHYQPTTIEDLPFSYHGHNPGPPSFAQNSTVYEEGAMDDEIPPAPPVISNLPVAMSAVAQQLQHIQDGQGYANLAPDALHGGVHDNSTLPLPYHSQLYTSPLSNFVSLADISPPSVTHQQPMALGPLHAPHLWPTGGWTPSPDMDIVLISSQDQLSASHFPSSDLTGFNDDTVTNADQDPVDDQFNLGLAEFLYNWAHSTSLEGDVKKSPRGPSLPAIENQREIEHNGPMVRSDLQGERCDIQRINWSEIGVSRIEARQMRRHTYRNYANLRNHLQWHPRLNGARLSDDQDYFRFRRMDFDHPVHLSHFQLRNLLSCGSRDHIYYAGRSVVHHYSPASDSDPSGPTPIAIDLTNPIIQPIHAFPGNGVQISTLTAAHDILVAGGFSGEYGLINLRAPAETRHSEGILTQHVNGITNHVQVYLPRNSSAPVAAFASNDMSMRILDITTNKLLVEHKYEQAVNCSAVSPDQRLRVLVGDNRNVMICNAETGEILQDLEGHRDYGFACDWADDGWTVATGNQDMQVKIWDARKWTSSSGVACPVATIAAEMAGVRKLKFSPLGSGKRVLVAAEPADFVNVIDAETFSSKQTLSFFGEIGGVDFTNDGQDLIIANCDGMRGGIMEFERCNFAAEGSHGLDEFDGYAAGRHRTRRERGYDWNDSDETIVRNPKARGTETQRSRRAALLGTNMGIF
ncbi:putative WD repeat-containing [Hyphodiscus hymeniophilus]|uniref:WD repeat-containing n=1 Tax=Hyphodiscus hymeniophilus TaxID=353542 RepID=A0A9P6VNT6_9HELO|nr:putative WD repeat-containing [Hyphodiscus hymeniophilus]